MSDYLIVIEADINDGDYIHELTSISAQKYKEVSKLLKKVAEAIKNYNKNHPYSQNWTDVEEKYEGILTEGEIDAFNEYRPYMSDFEVHSIESIEVYPIQKKKKLL